MSNALTQTDGANGPLANPMSKLSGFVSSRDNINRAVAVAQGVKGVTSVANDMRVK